MTEQLNKYLEKQRHPSVEYWFSKLNEALKRNTVAFQAAFGILSFGSLTGFIYAISRRRPENKDFLWLAMWAITFGVYVITIQLEHWKERDDITREQRRIDIKAKEIFNTKFVTWLYARAANKSDEEALDLFERGMVVFGAIPTDTVNKQLTQMMMMMNDVFFHMQPTPEEEEPELSETTPDLSQMNKEEKLDFIASAAPKIDEPDLDSTD
jgi:hypothetical protein